MTKKQNARYNTGIISLLQLLDIKHPDAQGMILLHGNACDTEPYVEIARVLDFKFECTTTSAEFRRQIESHMYWLLLMIVGDTIDQDMKDVIIQSCERINPIYLLQINTKSGDVPGTDKRYRCFMHHRNIVPGSEIVDRVSQATLQLLEMANKEHVNQGPVPDYLEID